MFLQASCSYRSGSTKSTSSIPEMQQFSSRNKYFVCRQRGVKKRKARGKMLVEVEDEEGEVSRTAGLLHSILDFQ